MIFVNSKLIKKLAANITNTVNFSIEESSRIALLFPGQGSQFIGMCGSLLNDFPYVKEYYHEASDLLGFDIADLCQNGTEEKLNLTANTQPSILLLSFCAFQVLRREFSINPILLAGHSLGEISALCCSGAISLNDALKIVRRRGEIMQSAVGDGMGSMAAINRLSSTQVTNLLHSSGFGKEVVISNINSETQTVISGEKEAVNKVSSMAKLEGAICIPLKVSAPFHSPLMKAAAKEFGKELSNYHFSKMNYPVVSNVRSKPYQHENEIRPLLVEQMTEPVNWLKISAYIEKSAADLTLELPPGNTLTKLFKRKDDRIQHYTFDQIVRPAI